MSPSPSTSSEESNGDSTEDELNSKAKKDNLSSDSEVSEVYNADEQILENNEKIPENEQILENNEQISENEIEQTPDVSKEIPVSGEEQGRYSLRNRKNRDAPKEISVSGKEQGHYSLRRKKNHASDNNNPTKPRATINRRRSLPLNKRKAAASSKTKATNSASKTRSTTRALAKKREEKAASKTVAKAAAAKPVSKAASPAKGSRGVLGRPTRLVHVKDKSVSRKFEVVARRTQELQYHVTWEEEQDQEAKPKFQPMLMVNDELIEDSQNPLNDRFFRDQSQLTLLVPDGFQPKEFGVVLEQVGKEMKKGVRSGRGWKVVENIKEFHHRLFGEERKFRPNGNGTTKQQAAKNNDFLGPGYECPDVTVDEATGFKTASL